MAANQRDRRQIHQFSVMLTVSLGIFARHANGADPPNPSGSTSVDSSIAIIAAKAPAKPSVMLDGPELQDVPTWSEVLRAVVLTAIPDKYEDLRHWDKTNEIFDGFRIQQRGFNIRASERKRKVNHGAWHKYKIELIDPANTLKLVIDQVRPTGTNQFQFNINFSAKLRCRADFEHWVLGVKGFNVTVVSEADVRIVVHCQLTIRTESDRKNLIPDLVFEPRVNDIKLFLTDLDVKRIGELRGDLAEEIGRSSRHDIENLLQAQESRATRKANEAIDKKRNELRFSTSRLWK